MFCRPKTFWYPRNELNTSPKLIYLETKQFYPSRLSDVYQFQYSNYLWIPSSSTPQLFTIKNIATVLASSNWQEISSLNSVDKYLEAVMPCLETLFSSDFVIIPCWTMLFHLTTVKTVYKHTDGIILCYTLKTRLRKECVQKI